MKCDIEIFLNHTWEKAASFELKTPDEVRNGIQGAGFFEYDMAYALAHVGAGGIAAVSCRYPVNFEYHRLSCWPAFLLDMLPVGANRRFFLGELGITNSPEADWPLLLKGGGNSPGNIRIAQAAPPPPENHTHEGFSFDEVVGRAENFIEYARENHAPVAGSSGAQGDAPKFLLTQDRREKFHADGALADHLAFRHWLVKFPRGKRTSDRDILRNEAAYYGVARSAGLHVGGEMRFDSDALFIPRFDRDVTGKGVKRFGLESLSSLSNITAFGVSVPMETFCAAIARFSSEPAADLREFVFRDILNVALGNTDNHGRNTAMIKYPDGTVRLSPLYDFAPMFLDDQGIPRICRWSGAEVGGMPEWGRVAELLEEWGPESEETRKAFADFAETVERLPDIMAAARVDQWLIERLSERIDAVRISLQDARPVTRR